ncbi:hypothetical protein [Bowmanella denitrificans]|uniref:hypothetical protein n=1 Tax=Bowmanella denitrificans TaxID=366582 RepID=UPI0011AF32F3|nr:hypothetical protein [Bowmanella denitrificans]
MYQNRTFCFTNSDLIRYFHIKDNLRGYQQLCALDVWEREMRKRLTAITPNLSVASLRPT